MSRCVLWKLNLAEGEKKKVMQKLLYYLAMALAFVTWSKAAQEKKASQSEITSFEKWEGDVVAPNWTSHERFLLKRDGAKITGYYVHEPTGGAMGSFYDIEGSVSPNGEIRITDGTFIWKGRQESPTSIEGKKPNGPEGKSPEFPFTLHLIGKASYADLPPPLEPTSSDWGGFLTDFKAAVAKRNQAVLAKMMAPHFYLQNSTVRSVSDAFRQLDWRQLDKAVTTGSVLPINKLLNGEEQRYITDFHPCPRCKYAVAVSFLQDRNSQWRWNGVSYPGD